MKEISDNGPVQGKVMPVCVLLVDNKSMSVFSFKGVHNNTPP